MNPANQSPLASMLIPIIIIYAVFYFIIIRPQKNEQKEHKKMINNLKKNDEVVTNSGIHGTIVNVKEKTFALRIDDNAKIEIDKSAIAYLKKKSE
ncbi:MAG: preprotein translocase subunit YajC [Candidatus Omnitrophica bacterium]|nr:preprotein translocase subunit YajC [Candidatus Omnitrophota bacterium]MDD5352591.1 preprotein translocase subunit YajC [Candidatus Omnitrophota bacterium]MDD5550189.1 preprotein translocase subunit YajC [Candidatus Omnitrophota bacterium]